MEKFQGAGLLLVFPGPFTHFCPLHMLVVKQPESFLEGGGEMGCCKGPKKKGPPPVFSAICAAFGAGVFLALLCSKLVLVLAAAFLVALGVLACNEI